MHVTSHRYELASDVIAGDERVPPALLGWYIIKAGIMDEYEHLKGLGILG